MHLMSASRLRNLVPHSDEKKLAKIFEETSHFGDESKFPFLREMGWIVIQHFDSLLRICRNFDSI